MITIKAFYIKETDKPNKLKQILNIINIQNNELIIQPINEKRPQKHIAKLVKKINKICQNKNVQNIVLSKKLKNNQEFINNINFNEINIFNGRWLFNYIAYETIDFIVQNTRRLKEQTEIAILTTNITNQAIENIKLLAKEYKRINIVTNHINEFKYLEKKIYNEYGMMITVTNNKRKSIAKSEIILNFDFEMDLLNQYNIYEKAIIINIQGNMQIRKKRFNGLVINDYEINSTRADDNFELSKLKEFYLKDLLEAKIYRKDNFANIRRDITSVHYKIKELYGVNGKVF